MIGILRVMYAEEAQRRHHSKKKLERIAEAARELKGALAMAAPHDPGTVPYERAIDKAETAVKTLELIFPGVLDRMPDLLRVAGSRVRGDWKPYRPNEAQIKWAVGKLRS
ncbi:MAG TPA: hypothetical protein VF395_06640 [Polyangiaceae bacterium]